MCKLSGRLKPFVAIARHTGTKPLIEAHGHNLVLRGVRNGIVADRETQTRQRATVEWPNADETFEGDDGKSPQISAPIGLDAVNLRSEQLFPVCSPALPRSRCGIHSPEDVLQFPLLHLNDRRDWSRWLEAAGASGEGLLHGPILNHASLLIDAAIDGQGIALARTALAAADLINGRLVRPFQITLSLKNTYWIVCPKATSALPKIAAFRAWLLAEAAADVQQLDRTRIKRVSARVEGPALVA